MLKIPVAKLIENPVGLDNLKLRLLIVGSLFYCLPRMGGTTVLGLKYK